MASRHRDRQQRIQAELDAALAELQNHPYNRTEIVAAREIIDGLEGEDAKTINDELTAQNLPDLVEVGRVTAKYLTSFARLHRRRVKLENRLRRMKAKESGQ